MMDADDAPYAAGRLVQWGLRNGAHPKRNDEYQALLARYLDRLEFREVVQRFAEGLELEILEASTEHGMVLAPLPGSAFATQASDYRPSSNEDTRLLDGLVQVAIAATVYPRAMDLLGDPTTVRNPVTVAEIEETLRQLVNRLDEAAKQQPDPVPEEAGGLYEAWRVYKHRQAQRSTKDQRASPFSTHRIIEYALDYLCKQHCFQHKGQVYRPLWRYQVLVQEHAASRAHAAVKRALNPSQEKL
ncbi:hypothetical protein [Deinococcus multiflagellatus]|uniref:hypothetical protein n=1 Tax=Deinococcus multiflagellatus TaxID=1656887 RepID=UPI001CCCC09B|nr:hypothetical protein [Deinococcus multiflagellatus]MBZ9712471.1 hypothetical protein [Deinococcus multiflagellatus]